MPEIIADTPDELIVTYLGRGVCRVTTQHDERVATDRNVPLSADAPALYEGLQDTLECRRARRAFGRGSAVECVDVLRIRAEDGAEAVVGFVVGERGEARGVGCVNGLLIHFVVVLYQCDLNFVTSSF